MNPRYWDSWHEVDRLIERLRAGAAAPLVPVQDLFAGSAMAQLSAMQDELRHMQARLTSGTAMMAAQDLLRGFERVDQLLATRFDLATTETLSAALGPFPDVRHLTSTLHSVETLDLLVRFDRTLSEARFVAELEIPEDEPEDEPRDAAIAEQAEAQLVELVAPEALASLKRVAFAPLILLDRAFRDPQITRRMSARDFEGFVAALVENLGFEDVQLTPASGDGGRDVVATKRVSGIPILCAFECKRYAPDRAVGPAIARALLGTIMHGTTRATMGVLVTTSYFTPAARRFIVTEPKLDGKDFDGIVQWLQEYSSGRTRVGGERPTSDLPAKQREP